MSTTRVAKEVPTVGGRVLRGPHEVPGGDLVDICVDPHGAAFGAVEFKRS